MQQETSQESWPVFKRLLGYVRDRKLGLVGGIIGMLGYAAVDTTFVYSIKPLIDQGLNGNDSSVLKWMPFFVLGIVALAVAPPSSPTTAWPGSATMWVMRLQQQVFSHLMAMPMSFFDRQNTGNLLSKVTYDAGQVSSAASSTLVLSGARRGHRHRPARPDVLALLAAVGDLPGGRPRGGGAHWSHQPSFPQDQPPHPAGGG